MTSPDARAVPVDAVSAERLSAQGLTYRTIDASSDADTAAFLRADARGFLAPEPSDESIAFDRGMLSERRNIGVFESGADAAPLPVATVNSWATPLTVPGGELDMWAISSVTVAGTHRRRGVARALLEGELRAAASAGVPLAGLTVSEATIYGRYGFASALPMARVTVHTRRAGWAGGAPAGRLEYIERSVLKENLAVLHEVARTQRAGEIPGWDGRWARFAGLSPASTAPAAVRGVRYLDEAGGVRGVMAYTLTEVDHSFRFELQVQHLTAVTPEALRALWGFALQHDLVDRVSADLRPLDDPIVWLVADRRGVEVVVHDHGWLRVLDVPAALGGRRYRSPLDVVFAVDDPLGFATGSWRLVVDPAGAATASAADGPADVVLDVAALSALFLGGATATQLAAAGRLSATSAVAASLDDAFRTAEAPALSIWY